MTGYTRQSTIVDGQVASAEKFNSEYDQLLAAFHEVTGHTHDGTVGGGALVAGAVMAYDATTTYTVGNLAVESEIIYISRVAGNTGNTPSASATQWLSTAVSSVEILGDTTPQLGGDLDCNDKTFKESSYNMLADVTLPSGSHFLQYSLGDFQQVTATGNFSFNVDQMPTGRASAVIVDAVNWGDHTVTLPVGTRFSSGTAPTFTSGGTDRFIFMRDSDDLYSLFMIGTGVA